jgi:hypothetical protein
LGEGKSAAGGWLSDLRHRACRMELAPEFMVEGGRCWRMTRDPEAGRQGMTMYCPETPIWRGRWQDNSRKWWPRIESCDDHADQSANGLGRLPAQFGLPPGAIGESIVQLGVVKQSAIAKGPVSEVATVEDLLDIQIESFGLDVVVRVKGEIDLATMVSFRVAIADALANQATSPVRRSVSIHLRFDPGIRSDRALQRVRGQRCRPLPKRPRCPRDGRTEIQKCDL